MSIALAYGGIFSPVQPDLATPAAVQTFLRSAKAVITLDHWGGSSARNSANTAADATFQALRTVVVPGLTLGPNDGLIGIASFEYTNSANSKNLIQRWGPTTQLFTSGVSSTQSAQNFAALHYQNSSTLFVNGSALSAGGQGWGTAAAPLIESTLDNTISQNYQFGANWTAATLSETITLRATTLLLVRG